MRNTLSQELTAQFKAWEERSRGWDVFEIPVHLEPIFVPFFFHTTPQEASIIDDGRRPSFLDSLACGLKKLFAPQEEPEPAPAAEDTIQAFAYDSEEPLCTLAISFPKGHRIPTFETEQLLIMLSSCQYPVSFEIIATGEKITVQYTCVQADTLYIQSQLKAYFPGSSVVEGTDSLSTIFENPVYVLDLGLREEFMRPLLQLSKLDSDPHTSLFGVLDHLPRGKHAAVQVLFSGCRNPWSESILRAVSTDEGDPFFDDAPEMVFMSKQKVSAPLFAVVIRAIGCAETEEGAHRVAWNIGEALVRQSRSRDNSLMPLSDLGYSNAEYLENVLNRKTQRTGMILNSKELANFVHYPSASVTSAKLERDIRKTKAVPAIALNHQLVLGINQHQGIQKAVTLDIAQRVRHTHIIGATGVGKSTVILTSAVQDILNGNGLLVLDPHGDTIDNILPYIPEQRANDVLLIDPTDSEFPVGFNILSAHNEIEKEILSSDLVAAFRRQSTSWGDQMGSVLANAILAFVESTEGGTLVDLRRFLVEKSFRDKFLSTVTDPNIVYYWHKEYPLLKSSSIGSILTRLDSFLRPKLIRNMVAQRKSIDFQHLMDTKKIILVKLSHGMMGAENSYLLGTFIVSKIYQAAMARQAQAKEERTPFFVYVDEFQNYATESMCHILEGTRKYGLSLTLAHQGMRQLDANSELASSIIANAGTRICFRLGEIDAKKFADGFSYFDAQDLQNLSIGEAIGRIEKSENDFSLITFQLPASEVPKEIQEQVIASSREMYGTPKHIVEQALAESMQVEYTAKVEIPVPVVIPVERIPAQKEEPPPPKPAPAILSPLQVPITLEPEKEDHQQEKKKDNKHRYLQTLIKRMAESRGFKTTIEEVTPDGKGKVDVGLLRNDKRIACEISVTTTDTWEVHNVEKCLAAGYDTVIVCSTDKRHLGKIHKRLHEKLDATLQSKVLTLEPEALFLYLDQLTAQEISGEERIKGYRVNVTYTAVPENVAKQQKEQIIKAIIDSKRKKKEK